MELQKKLGVEISNLFSCPSSFFRKETNKEKAGEVYRGVLGIILCYLLEWYADMAWAGGECVVAL